MLRHCDTSCRLAHAVAFAGSLVYLSSRNPNTNPPPAGPAGRRILTTGLRIHNGSCGRLRLSIFFSNKTDAKPQATLRLTARDGTKSLTHLQLDCDHLDRDCCGAR